MKKMILTIGVTVLSTLFAYAAAPAAPAVPAAPTTPAVAVEVKPEAKPEVKEGHHGKGRSHHHQVSFEDRLKKLTDEVAEAKIAVAKLEGNEKVVAEADLKAVDAFMEALNAPTIKEDFSNFRRLFAAAARNLAHAKSHVRRAEKKAHKEAKKAEKEEKKSEEKSIPAPASTTEPAPAPAAPAAKK